MAIPAKLIKDSKSMNEHRDCAVKAVAITCRVPYKVAHQALKDQGRRNRQGTWPWQTEGAVKSLGKRMVDVTSKFRAKTITTLGRELPSRGVFLVHVRGHIIACRGGEVLDWTEGRRHRIIKIMRVTV